MSLGYRRRSNSGDGGGGGGGGVSGGTPVGLLPSCGSIIKSARRPAQSAL